MKERRKTTARSRSGPDRPAAGSRPRARRTPRTVATTLLGPVLLAAGCAVPAPTVAQGLDYGFRTPEQAFRSWRTAVQGELLAQEYRSLSKSWRARNGGVSILDYAQAREQVLEEFPQLRWILYRADEPEVLAEGPANAVVQARIRAPLWYADRWLVVRLVRQGFWDVWTEDVPYEPSLGAVVRDPVEENYLHFLEDKDLLYGIAPVPELADGGARDVHLLQVGWEWKIDDFQVLDGPLRRADLGIEPGATPIE